MKLLRSVEIGNWEFQLVELAQGIRNMFQPGASANEEIGQYAWPPAHPALRRFGSLRGEGTADKGQR